ncbi:ultraviolet-B receptor UVR8 isoform X2 [Dendroctonus ponderosae]|uniref:ultraviolet-B receptor UVR8 isoform X2 n=1 Tax=Dendroctonus ponderosae TaxID=77166 RepID=UPI00203543E4|nr:ultraviolet-B receptor UVR8 isoform X2 [Dendroctonus ponderosae]
MRILCKGFNLYNQLNCPAKCPTVGEFQLTGNCSPGDHFSIAHTYSVLASDTVLKLHCNLAKTQQLDLCNTKISRVTVGDDKLLVLAEDGQLLKVSLKDWSPAPLPKFIGNQDRVKCISSTSKLFMAYSENGLLYTIPEQVDFVNRNIVDMQCGREHCLLLDTDGNVYSFGAGSRGQLGTGQLDDQSSPVLLQALAGIKIAKIAAGGWHSAAISEEGDLYTWGWNSNGQLGLASFEAGKEKTVSVMATPHVVDIDNSSSLNVTQVACGTKHTIALLGLSPPSGQADCNDFYIYSTPCGLPNIFRLLLLHKSLKVPQNNFHH